MEFDYARRVRLADQQIRRFGAPAKLRRASGDRDCWACTVDYAPRSREGQLFNRVDRIVLVSALDLAIPPDAEKDSLVVLDPISSAEVEVLRIMAPVGRLAPAGIVIYWELHLQR